MLAEGQFVTYSSGASTSNSPDLRFIHYNDVYHVEAGSQEPVGGIARFRTLCNFYHDDPKFHDQPDLLTFFSGDAFNPSLESSVTKGKHMVAPLNKIGTNVACLGNHDLDFGIEQFQTLAKQCTFPWLCANVLDPNLGEDVPLADCKKTVMLESSNGIKIGVIGVVEREWLATINTLPPKIQYLSAGETVAKLAPALRSEGAEIVIVLSHQRQPNDEKLANRLEPGVIDIILGGHDHDYAHSINSNNGIHILRSGTDFRNLSYVEARRRPEGKGWNFEITRRDIVSSIPEEPHALEMVKRITKSLAPKLEKPIGYTCAPLDARFTTVRKAESNLGNFVCDLIRFHYHTDCCIMAAGTIRGDQIYPPGVLRVKDMMNCFPFEDPCVVIELKGSQIVEALENGVYTYPALEGRFPQVSGIEFTFDPSKKPGQRCLDIRIGGQPVQPDQEYKLATRDYMARGKDGFKSLMLEGQGGTAKSIVSDENGMLISMILRQYFMSLKVLGRWRQFGQDMDSHWNRVTKDLHEVHPVTNATDSSENSGQDKPREALTQGELPSRNRSRSSNSHRAQNEQSPSAASLDEDEDSEDEHDTPVNPEFEHEQYIARKVLKKWQRLAGLNEKSQMCESKEFAVTWTKGIAPRLEGRIKIIGVEA